MDHAGRSNWALVALSPGCDRELTTIAAPLHDNRKRSGAATLRLISFCLVVLLASTAVDQSKADGGLPPPDAQRSDTSVQRAPSNDLQTGPAAGEQQRALEQERSKANALQDELASTRMELILTISKAVDSLKASSDREEYLRRELAAARQELAVMRRVEQNAGAQPGTGTDPMNKQGPVLEEQRRKAEGLSRELERLKTEAVTARNAAEASLAGTRQALEAERQKAEGLARDLALAQRELERLKTEAVTARNAAEASLAGTRQALEAERQKAEGLARDLALAQRELERLKTEAVAARNGAEASLAGTQQALEEERQKAEGLARDLALAQRELGGLKTEAVAARNGAEASLAGTQQALEEERRKVGLLERDLAGTRQSIEALETSARLAATTQAGAMQGRQLAEAAATQAGEALAREREKAGLLASDLETARRERDAAKEELTRISAAWEEERKKAVDLARDLASARKDVDALKRPVERRTSRIENPAKAHPANRASARPAQRRSAPKSMQQEVGSAEARKPRAVRLTTIVLPDALLPRRPPAEGFRQ